MRRPRLHVTELKIDGGYRADVRRRPVQAGSHARAMGGGRGRHRKSQNHQAHSDAASGRQFRPGGNPRRSVPAEVRLQALNEERADQGLAMFANPRNAAAGAIRQLDPRVTASRPLAFFGYSIGRIEDQKAPATQQESLDRLSQWGLPVNPHHRHHRRWRSTRILPGVGDKNGTASIMRLTGWSSRLTAWVPEDPGVVSRDPR